MDSQKLLFYGVIAKDVWELANLFTLTDTYLEDRFAHCKNILL